MSREEMEAFPVVAEGKTKVLRRKGPGRVYACAKDDITAGDGAKRDSFRFKSVLATMTTCAVFELLEKSGVPTCFVARTGPAAFEALECAMLPYEIVGRAIALGSYCKRHPEISPRTRLPKRVVEFFLKTSGRRFGGLELPKDDPFILDHSPNGLELVRPDIPVSWDETQHIPGEAVWGEGPLHPFPWMEELMRKTFDALERAWKRQGCTLADLKIECGYDPGGRLVVADVIDNDSWRLFDEDGRHLDKQRYRDGASIEEVAALYKRVARRALALAA